MFFPAPARATSTLTKCWGKGREKMVVVQFWSLKIFPLEISRVSSRESGRLLREPSIWGHAFLCLGDRGTPTDCPEGGPRCLRHIRGPLPRGAQQPIMAKPTSPEPWCRRRKMREAISALTFLSLFAPLTSPTFSLPISPFFCLGNSIHPTPTPRVQTGGAASRRLAVGVLPAARAGACQAGYRQSWAAGSVPGSVPTDGTALARREANGFAPRPALSMAGFRPSPFPRDIPPP